MKKNDMFYNDKLMYVVLCINNGDIKRNDLIHTLVIKNPSFGDWCFIYTSMLYRSSFIGMTKSAKTVKKRARLFGINIKKVINVYRLLQS